MSLLHLEVLDASHFSILGNHALNDVIDLVFLFEVLGLGLSFKLFAVVDLVLNLLLILNAILDTGCFSFSLDLVVDFLGSEHDHVDLGVLFLFIMVNLFKNKLTICT